MRFQVGDRVVLLSTTSWVICSNNPAVGSEWYCEGVITAANRDGGLNVDWDNGCHNAYHERDNDIELVNEEILV